MRFRPITCLLLLSLLWTVSSKAQSLLWAKNVTNGPGGASPSASTIDANGNIWIIGLYSDTTDFDPGPGTALLLPAQPGGAHNIFVVKLDSLGQFVWAGGMGSSIYNRASEIRTDAAGNAYVVGNFFNTMDFDMGAGVANVASPYQGGVFVMKLAPNGAYQWVKVVPGNFHNGNYGLDLDAAGNIYVSGEYRFTGDFDPGPGVVNLTAPANYSNGFVLKLDASGNFVWVKEVVGTNSSQANDLRLDAAGNIYVVGLYTSTTDMDPGPGVYNLTCSGVDDVFALKLNASGNFVWARAIGGPNHDWSWDMDLSPAGVMTIVGETEGGADFDPGPANLQLPYVGGTDVFVERLDSAGNLVWAKVIGGISDDRVSSVRVDAAGGAYLTGSFQEVVDFDPGPGTMHLSSAGEFNNFVQKFGVTGDAVWAKSYRVQSQSYSGTVDLNAGGALLLSAWMGGPADVDFGPGNTTIAFAPGDMSLAKYRQDSCFTLGLSLDSIRGITCANPVGYAAVQVVGAHGPATVTWNTTPATTGLSANFTTGGIYSALVTDALGCSAETAVVITAPTYPLAADLSAVIVPTDFRPGFPSTFQLQASNAGCTPTNGQLNLTLDNLLQYVSAVPAPTSIVGNTLTWNFTGLAYGNSSFTPSITVQTPVWANLGDTLCLTAVALPLVGDQDTLNNRDTTCVTVTGAYDPNDKRVDPPGHCDEHYVFRGTPLTYTVRFQNTGTASAVNVRILDGLSANLDLSTFRIIAHSHPMTTQVLPGDILDFAFDNIQLPDSHANEPASHGFLVFEAMPVVGIPAGTEIRNRAAIYFDFNQPVFTNQVISTITDTLPFDQFADTATVCSGGSYTFMDGFVATNITSDLVHSNMLTSPDGCPLEHHTYVFVQQIDTNVTLASGTFTVAATWGNFQWLDCNNGLAPIPGANSWTFTPTQPGSYAVSIDQWGCLDTSSCHSFQAVSITQYDTATVCSGSSYTFHDGFHVPVVTAPLSHTSHFAIPSGDSAIVTHLLVTVVDTTVTASGPVFTAQAQGATFQWLDCNNAFAPLPGVVGNVFQSPSSGSWAVQVTQSGCVDTSACHTFLVSVTHPIATPSLTIIPNPSQGRILLRSDAPLDQIVLTNALGVVVLRHHAGLAQELTLDLSALPRGIYHLLAGAGRALGRVVLE